MYTHTHTSAPANAHMYTKLVYTYNELNQRYIKNPQSSTTYIFSMATCFGLNPSSIQDKIAGIMHLSVICYEL